MNYSELSQAISDWLNKSSLDKIMPTLIRFGQRDLEDNLRIRPMEYHPATASIAAATASLALPSDFLELIFLELQKDGIRYVVDGRESTRVLHRERPSITTPGVPRRITRIADDFYFDFVTDAAYTRDWSYYRRLPVLTSSTTVPQGGVAPNSNWWSENAEEAFLMSCLNKSSMYVTGISAEDKKKWKDGYLEARENLRLRFAKEETGGATHRSTPFSL
jgi:hypothetical protein